MPPKLDPLALPTLGGKQLWADELVLFGYRLQRHVLTRHYRLLDPTDARLLVGTERSCRVAFAQLCEERDLRAGSEHLVLLLHGFLRSKDVFGRMYRELEAAGYDVEAVNYPSRWASLEDHARQLGLVIGHAIPHYRRLSIVGHSMGGLIGRLLLSEAEAAWRQEIDFNRLLTIGTPHRGAELAARLADLPGFYEMGGPASRQLHPERAVGLPPPACRFGTVAGTAGTGRGFNPLLPGEDDLVVSARSAGLEGSEDHLVVRGLHTFLMNDPQVVAATLRYLETGRFAED